MKEVELKVGELTSRKEFGRGIVRLNRSSMRELGIDDGDVVKIKGKKETGAIAKRPYPADVGKPIIRLDGLLRKNAGTSIGENVKVSKTKDKEATRVVIAPAGEHVMLRASPRHLKRNLLMRPVTKGDVIVPSPGGVGKGAFFEELEEAFGLPFGMTSGRETRLVVAGTTPSGIVKITDRTKIKVKAKPVKVKPEAIPTVTYEDIGGLREQIQRVREMIELPLKRPEIFDRLGVEAPKGVLLHGPPGTGKTLLAKAVANETGAHFLSIAGPEVMSKWYGQSEKKIREIFKEGRENAPSIIFMDEIDAIAPKRGETRGEVERRVVSQLLTSMDGLEARGKVIVIAATNRVNDVDPALRRPGRFDREIETPPPDKAGRKEILQIHTRNMPLAKDVDLDHIASITYGYVGADLEGICKEAAMYALRRVLPDLSSLERGEEIPSEVLEKLEVCKKDFDRALRVVEPSAMREVLVEVPKVGWGDVGGLEEAKQKLRESVEWPLKSPESFKRMGIKPARGILLYGPPGCGKTLLARAVSNESDANFISIKGPELFSKWVGESERMVRDIFRRAKQVAPSVIFFDELDALAPRRGLSPETKVSERVVSQLLTELSGLEELEGVAVLAASNRPDIVDPALLRPGRFDRKILVPDPDKESKLRILKIHSRDMPLADDVDLKDILKKTENFSGADLEALCNEAGLEALREDLKSKKVKRKHFESALKKITPTITDEMRKFFREVDISKLQRKEEEERRAKYIG